MRKGVNELARFGMETLKGKMRVNMPHLLPDLDETTEAIFESVAEMILLAVDSEKVTER